MAIKEKVTNPSEFKHVEGQFPVEYVYTSGTGAEAFLLALRDKEKFKGSKCGKCGKVYIPTVSFCERCFARIEGTVDIPNDGIVESFTVSHYDHDGNRLERPDVLGIIRLKGASTVLLHRLLVKPENAAIGMKVAAKFLPKAKRKGSITDIEGFVAKR